MLRALGDAERAVEAARDADGEGEAVAVEGVDVLADLVAEDGELTERGVEDALLEPRVVAEQGAEVPS